jgi:HAMP domain-containing protein
MIHFLLNLKVRVKLLIAFGSLIVLSTALASIFFITTSRIDTYQTFGDKIDEINIQLLEMDAAAKFFIFEGFKTVDFQKNGESHSLDQYLFNRKQIIANLDSIELGGIYSNTDLLVKIRTDLNLLDAEVKTIVGLYKQRGFKDFGLEGSLRETIHNVENSLYPIDRVEMLSLRRHEKDFFLRKDTKYLKEFTERCDRLLASFEGTTKTQEQEQTLKDVKSYKNLFTELVAIESAIGLAEDIGLKGNINNTLAGLKDDINSIRLTVKKDHASFKASASAFLLIVFIIQLVLGIALAVAYAHVLTKAIKELQQAMKSLANGIFPKSLVVKSNEEIGQTKGAFNQLLERMKAASNFSDSLGKGEMNVKYNEQFSNDVLAKSLLVMQQQLTLSALQQEAVNWSNYGLAQLSDILKLENEKLETLGDRLLRFLVNYLPANQGALYTLSEDEEGQYLERISSYAYDKKKFVNQRLVVGDGLIGQVVLEKQPIILSEVPADYIKITSGLGEALPRFVVIYPLLVQGEVMGAIELASFDNLEKYKLDFLAKISENIASILMNKKIAGRTHAMLEDAKRKEQLLSSQEEELRQNSEEMKTVQEQLLNQQQTLEDEIKVLRANQKNSDTLAQESLRQGLYLEN